MQKDVSGITRQYDANERCALKLTISLPESPLYVIDYSSKEAHLDLHILYHEIPQPLFHFFVHEFL